MISGQSEDSNAPATTNERFPPCQAGNQETRKTRKSSLDPLHAKSRGPGHGAGPVSIPVRSQLLKTQACTKKDAGAGRGAVSFFFLLLHRRPRPLCPPDDGAGPSTPLTAQTGPGLISSQEPAAAICATPSVLHVSITQSTWETTRCPTRQLFALPDNVRKALCEARKCVQQIKLTPLARNLFTLPIRGEFCFVFCFWPLLVRTGLVLCISIGGNLYFRCIFRGQPIFVTIVY